MGGKGHKQCPVIARYEFKSQPSSFMLPTEPTASCVKSRKNTRNKSYRVHT